MSAATTLDELTKAVVSTLTGLMVNVTRSGLAVSFSLQGAKTTRAVPYGRYQVHIVLERDTLNATAVFNDYGTNNRGANSSRDSINLSNIPNLAAEIGQYLQTGSRG